MKRFEIGEQVVFLHERGGGVVTRIKHNTIFVKDETGFERPFQRADIGKIYGTQHSTPNPISDKNVEYAPSRSVTNRHTEYKTHWEIDLHFDDLSPDGQQGETNSNILERQLKAFKEFFWLAQEKKIRKLIVIHGFGKGILRKELQLFLIAQEGVDFFDAPYVQYGHGAIQIEIRYKY